MRRRYTLVEANKVKLRVGIGLTGKQISVECGIPVSIVYELIEEIKKLEKLERDKISR